MPTMNVLANYGDPQQNLIHSTASVTNPQIEEFFKTESFSKISVNFSVNRENFDLNNSEIIKINESSNLIRLRVNNGLRIDYVILMPNNSAVLYEKTLINESGNGNIEQYDENGMLVANFGVVKKDEKFNVKLNFVNNAALLPDQLECIKKTYDYIKKTCEKDTTCSISCDLSPQCATVMYGVAAAHCAATGNKPVKASHSLAAE